MITTPSGMYSAARRVSESLDDVIAGDEPGQPRRPIEVRGGQGVQVGDDNKQFNQFIGQYITSVQPAPGHIVRSAYVEQVKRIVPSQLHDRDGELAELEAFCTEPGRSSYVWWQAAAWAGKSALMSWFVLHPPPGVQIMSFFITARYKGQDDRVAFIDAMTEQLADLLGQPIPIYMTEATREPHLLRMLTQATEKCQRLVLVVDGLDEDRGVTTGPDAYSIAAMLPARTPDGLRVIVAGRPDPPVPADVPDDHPLRDPGIVRVLAASPSAQVVKADMQRELKRLLHGDQAERDMLGLVTAAGGGLSVGDLAELTGLPAYDIQENLHAVAGRTFTASASVWQPGIAPLVYVLGHEDLQTAATTSLGQARLAEYRDRLHTWADGYRQLGWPAGTPEYLLRGYFRMLQDATDLPRLIACATDWTRHDRMLDITAGDTAALTEIADVQDLELRLEEPDLSALARLNVHRSVIADRNAHVPSNLPAVWALVGHSERAEALARAIPDPDQRERAMTGLAQAAARAGDLDRAEAVAQMITDPHRRARALDELVEAAARAGDLDRAEAVAQMITDPHRRARALDELVEAAARAGDLDRIEAVAQMITDPDQRAGALDELAQAAARAGDLDRAEATVRMIINPYRRARALAGLAEAAARAGDREQASVLGDRAETAVRTIINPDGRARVLAGLAETAAGAGDLERASVLADRAEAAVRTIINPDRRARALDGLAQAAARICDPDRASALAKRAQAAAWAITDPDGRARVLAGLTETAADAGDLERASVLADQALAAVRSISNSKGQALALARLAEAAAHIGDLDRARVIAERAEATAWRIPDRDKRERVLTRVAEAAAHMGDLDRARVIAERTEEAARAITKPDQRVRALARLAEAAAHMGDLDRARVIAEQTEEAARRFPPRTTGYGRWPGWRKRRHT